MASNNATPQTQIHITVTHSTVIAQHCTQLQRAAAYLWDVEFSSLASALFAASGFATIVDGENGSVLSDVPPSLNVSSEPIRISTRESERGRKPYNISSKPAKSAPDKVRMSRTPGSRDRYK